MDVPKIRSILLCRNTKWITRIKCPKSLKKVYDAINICLEEFNDELLANFVPEKDDTKLDEVVSVFGEVKLNDIPSDTTAAITREMKNVVQSISVTDPEASHTVEFIVTDLDNVLKQFGYIENKWSVYGSYKTGLGCIDSDIDLYFETIRRTNKIAKAKILHHISRCLRRSRLFSDILYIGNARIPILKLKHVGTKKECDISFCESGVISSTLNKFYVELDPSVKIFTLYLKLLLKKYRLYGTNRMTNHVIFWLVVFFFQQKGLLPPVKDVRKEYDDCQETDLFENWNVSIKEDFSFPFKTRPNLSTLLFEFARFYKNFDFTTKVISPYRGDTIPIEEFSKWQIPEDILPFKFQSNNSDDRNTFYRHVINLQEPSILSQNLAKNVGFKILYFFRIFCYELLSSFKVYSLLDDDYLMDILPMDLLRKVKLPRDLKESTSTKLNFGDTKGLTKERLCGAIHGIMGTILKFELKNKIIMEDVFQVEYNTKSKAERVMKPVVYMNYSSTKDTWNNANVRKVLLFPSVPGRLNEGFGRSINVCFVGIIDPVRKEARIMIQTDLYLLRFLHKYGPKMLHQIISV